MKETKRYFIEHKQTRLWFYMDIGYEPIHCFGGWQTGQQMCIKHGWTNDPNKAKAFDTPEDAMSFSIYFIPGVTKDDVLITEHLFL